MTSVTPLDRHPATWEEYLARGEDRSEYIDGSIVMAPLPSRAHQQASRRLANLLELALPAGYAVTEAWGWKPGKNEYGPDVMVHPETDENVRFTGTPVLCAEILSSNRANDYIVKTTKYAEAGLDHYWILDPETASMDVMVRDGVHYRLETTVTRDAAGWVSFGIARVYVDLAALLS